MRLVLLCVPLLFAAPAKKQWSKAHGVGIVVPNSWKILERDQGARAFVVEGPQLGAGRPRLVIWNGGGAGERTLRKIAEQFDERVRQRPGWTRTAMAPRKVGPWPAMRVGYSFREGGKAKGRARISVILYGGNVYIVEMSAAARGFPAATFDAVERSLEVKPSRFILVGDATVNVPPGWEAKKAEDGLVARGPRRALVRLIREATPGNAVQAPPPGAKLDGSYPFQGKKRPKYTQTRKIEGVEIRMAWLQHRGWTAVVMMPVDAWEEIGPGAEAILRSLKPRPVKAPGER